MSIMFKGTNYAISSSGGGATMGEIQARFVPDSIDITPVSTYPGITEYVNTGSLYVTSPNYPEYDGKAMTESQLNECVENNYDLSILIPISSLFRVTMSNDGDSLRYMGLGNGTYFRLPLIGYDQENQIATYQLDMSCDDMIGESAYSNVVDLYRGLRIAMSPNKFFVNTFAPTGLVGRAGVYGRSRMTITGSFIPTGCPRDPGQFMLHVSIGQTHMMGDTTVALGHSGYIHGYAGYTATDVGGYCIPMSSMTAVTVSGISSGNRKFYISPTMDNEAFSDFFAMKGTSGLEMSFVGSTRVDWCSNPDYLPGNVNRMVPVYCAGYRSTSSPIADMTVDGVSVTALYLGGDAYLTSDNRVIYGIVYDSMYGGKALIDNMLAEYGDNLILSLLTYGCYKTT